MRPPSRSSTTAIILAGGRGERLGGRDKARLRHRNAALVKQLSQQLHSVAREIIIVRARPRDSLRLPAGSKRAWDKHSSHGPLSGVSAGLARASGHWCLFIPVDSYALPKNLLATLARGSHHGGYALHHDDHYYLHALLPRRQRHVLERFRRSGGRSAGNACRTLQLVPVNLAAAQTTWSINTPDELRRLHRRRISTTC